MQPRNAHSHRKTPSEIIADAPPILYINAIIHVISVLWLQNYKVLSLKPNFYSKSLNKNLFLPSSLTNSLLTLKMPCEPWSELIYLQTFKHYSKIINNLFAYRSINPYLCDWKVPGFTPLRGPYFHIVITL